MKLTVEITQCRHCKAIIGDEKFCSHCNGEDRIKKDYSIIHDEDKQYMSELKEQYRDDIKTLEQFQNYVKDTWCMAYGGMEIESGYLIISTGGYSENEYKLKKLRRTEFWTRNFTWERNGGHYYFWLGDRMSDDSWFIERVEE